LAKYQFKACEPMGSRKREIIAREIQQLVRKESGQRNSEWLRRSRREKS
jgi:hypothetical protein